MSKNRHRRDSSSDEDERSALPYYRNPNRVEPHWHHGPVTNQPSKNVNTIVINSGPTGQTGQSAPVVRQQRLWSTGLCDCCSDCGVCLCGYFCCLCQQCQISMDMGESCCVPICVPNAMMALRLKMRTQENIQGSIMDDCAVVYFCGICAQCQLAREIKHARMRQN